MDKNLVAAELSRIAELLTANVKYKGYTIEKSGMNFYVKDPSGHRAFGETPASVETAKKWIDQDISEKGKKASEKTAGGWPVKMVEKAPGFDAAFDDFLKHASMVLTDYMTKQFPTLRMPTLSAQEGGRYMKIVKEDGTTSRSVWAFVDKTNGDVLKPAGWNAPAKNARANVFDKASWRNVGAYGPAYMRNMMSSELMVARMAAQGLTDREVGRLFEIVGEIEAVTKEALKLMRKTNDRQVEDKAFRLIDQGVHNLELAAERLDAQKEETEGGHWQDSWEEEEKKRRLLRGSI